jgi:rubrerythrin
MAESRPHDGFTIRIRDFAGTAYGLWRCGTCGETGRLRQSFPSACPGCGAPREMLGYVAED